MTIREPDELLSNINRSIMLKALAISLVVHAVVVLGTSFGLYRDWGTYGLHTPSTIKQLKQTAAREAEAAARREAAAKKAVAEAEAAKVAATNAPAAPTAAVVPASMTTQTPGDPEAPELAPMPPKTSFTLGEDLNLD
jgi:hypothetical protein